MGLDFCNTPSVATENQKHCEAFKPMWTFDPKLDRCRRFIYGGCIKTENLFESEEGCKKICDPKL